MRSGRRSAIAGVASFGTAFGHRRPARVNRMYQVVNNLSHRGGRAFAARRRRLPLQRRRHHLSAIGARQLHVFVDGEFPVRHLQQRRLRADLRRHQRGADQPEPRHLRAGRVEGHRRRSRSTPGCATTCSASRRSPPTPTTCRRGSASRGRRADRSARSCAAARACSTIACRCARWRTRCCRPAIRPMRPRCASTSSRLSPTQAGAPVFPNILPAAIPLVTLPNLTTMDRALQNAYSQQVSTEIEQQLGERHDDQRRLSVPERLAAADVGQPERADLRGVRQQQRLPADLDLRQQQPVLVGRRLDVSRPARVARAANARVGPVSRVLHAVEGDEQRRRVLLQLADRSDRHLEGLGPRRQRSAASAGRQRVGAEAAACRSAAWCRPTRRRRSTSRPASRPSRARRAGRSSTASSFRATPAKARRSSA